MRRVALFAVLIPVILTMTASAAGALELRAPAEAEAPRFELSDQETDRLTITFTLSTLSVENLAVEEQSYQALTLPDGGMEGAPGTPGLPVITRLVALPDGALPRAIILSSVESRHAGFRVLPVQPDNAERFVIDRASYAAEPAAREAVSLGEPGILRDLRVVPVTFRPVAYDPVSGELRVTERLEVELDFSASDPSAERPRRRASIPESFDRLYRDVVLNYAQSANFRSGEAEVGPGTWLLIYPNSTAVSTRLQPLIDWRERQGYNVIAINTDGTGSTNGAIKNFIQGVYDTANPPLEFVTLAGDANGTYPVACFNETLSGYGGEGDHYYGTLEGGDILADVHIGRLSFRTTGELDAIIDKIVTYETDPPLADSGWFTRAGLCGDPSSSGISVIYTNQWVKSQLLANGYSQVDTIWSGNFATLMTGSINQGLSVFGYRGYWHMSGMSENAILNLSNGKELPFAVIVTCDTGSFQGDATCRSEAFLKAANGGGIGSVGTATLGTHTRYNNTYYYGVWDGAINGADHRIGAAHTRGKLELYANYIQGEPNKAEIWSVWNNLMGDPATDMYTAHPAALSVSYPAQLPPGADAVPVTVLSGGLPVADARVSLFKSGEISETAYSDAQGEVVLPLPTDASAGELLVTVSGHNLLSHLGSLQLVDVPVFPALASHAIDDSGAGTLGNGDGLLNPGERVELTLSLRNLGSSTAAGISATLSTDDAYITLLTDTQAFGDIPAGAEVFAAGPFSFALAPDAPDGHLATMVVEASNGFDSWTSLLRIPVSNAAFSVQDFTWSGGGTQLDPGESGTLSLDIVNLGSVPATGISATLVSLSSYVEVSDAEAAFGDLFIGANGSNTADPFFISVSADTRPGDLVTLSMLLSYNERAVSVIELQFVVGTAAVGDPTGPDVYGYYAFESTDNAWPQAPAYNWVEIQPSQGGSGSIVGLSDFGWAQDDTETLPLPFTFRYYGQDYDDISICSNGWVAMGTTSLVLFRNYTIPNSGSPPAMIAPFWDDFYQTSGNLVSYWNDTANHRYIVEWYNVRNEATGSYVTFQVILLDPAFHPTATGDGEIIFQYKTIVNNDSTNGYATAGIQNRDRSDGILLSYWNQHPATANNPSSNRAIRFLTLDADLQARLLTSPGQFEVTLPVEGSIGRSLEISNHGDAGSILYFALDPAALPAWLSLDKSGGTVPSGQNDILTLSFDAAGLALGTYETTLAINSNGEGLALVPVTLNVNDGTAAGGVPEVLILAQNHPNPFNPKTSIRFGLPESGQVTLTVFDVNGRAVKTLADGALPAGTHRFEWDGTDAAGASLASGVYFYRLDTAGERIRKKMLLLK